MSPPSLTRDGPAPIIRRMGKTSRPEPIPDFSDVHVRLKPFLGLRPGTWLSALYALLILLILFFLLFDPGIASSGTYYRISTFPDGAAVHVDGKYAGSTPGEFLIRRGERKVELLKPGYRTVALNEKVGGRVFGTLFVPPRRIVLQDLAVEDIDGLVAGSLSDLAATPYIPTILTNTVEAVKTQPELAGKLSDFLQKAKYFVSDADGLTELLKADTYLRSGGNPPASAAPIATLQAVLEFIQPQTKLENSIYWALVTLPPETSRALASTPEFQARHAQFLQELQGYLQAASRLPAATAGSAVIVAGLRFRPVPGGTLLQGKDDDPGYWRDRVDQLLPHPVAIPSFYLGENEVTNRQYAQFLAANPEWSKSRLDDLVRRGAAAEGYLASWTGDRYPDGADSLPVTGVPYAAAEAFSRWLSSQLPPALAGYEARLPSESEWEWAARGGLVGQPYPTGRTPEGARFLEGKGQGPAPVTASRPNGYGLQDMAGNVWEWCRDWYSPVAYFFTSRDGAQNSYRSEASIPFGAERVVRGGSWANEKEMVKVYVRGSQPPAWCTPYLGFRVALARR